MTEKPIVVLSNAKGQCVTFFWENRPEFYIGYRLIEHNPEILEESLHGIDDQPSSREAEIPPLPETPLPPERTDPWNKDWANSYTEEIRENPIQFSFRGFADGSGWACGLDSNGQQKREFYLQPTEDGVLMWMKLTTQVDLPGSCSVQQCLRFTGTTNVKWRQAIARVPFLSEFDVQAQGNPNTSLTWVRKGDGWVHVPVQRSWYHTRPGLPLVREKSMGEVAHGLIIRESLDGRFSSGMYWERTAYVGNRHPADCLHAAVDFGPLSAGQHRTVHGKFYFVEGTREQLLEVWRSDFPENNNDR